MKSVFPCAQSHLKENRSTPPKIVVDIFYHRTLKLYNNNKIKKTLPYWITAQFQAL